MSLPQLEQTLRARTNSAAIDIVVVRAQVPTIVSAGNGGGGSTLETSQPAQQRLQSDSLLRVSLLQCYIADLSFASIREQAVSCNRHTVRWRCSSYWYGDAVNRCDWGGRKYGSVLTVVV